jgi:2-dehydropantoate 2-reductase
MPWLTLEVPPLSMDLQAHLTKGILEAIRPGGNRYWGVEVAMRIAVMGAGSIGGYFGGMLARGGNEVSLVARGAHLEAITRDGLRVIRDSEEFIVHCEATDDPRQIGPVDLVLLTVKTYQNRQAVPEMRPMVGDNTTVLCLQNGIDTYQDPATQLGSERVLPGAAYIEASREGPGIVKQTGSVVRIVFGEEDGSKSERGERIYEALTQSGIPAELSADVKRSLWSKFLFIATMAGVTTLARQTMAEIMPRPEWRDVILGCLREIESVGRASGINLDINIVQDTVDYIEGSLEQMHASMHADFMAGRPLELEALNGAVVRAGRAAGMATPINNVIYAMLKPYEDGKG